MKQYKTLADTVYFWFGANDTSGSGNDGASPACDVRLAGAAADAAPVYSPTPVLLSHASYPAGCYEVAIAATTGNGFAANNTYAVFCTLAVDSQNPTGFVGSFDLKPVEANTKQVSGTAQTANDNGADINTLISNQGDWATATGFAVAGDIMKVSDGTGANQVDLTDGKVTVNNVADCKATGFATPTNITAGTIASVTNDVGITQAGADKVWGTTARALTDKAGFALSAAGIQAIWDALTSALTTVGSIGKLLVDNINATISSRSSHGDPTSGIETHGDSTWATATGFATENPPSQTLNDYKADVSGLAPASEYDTEMAHLDADISSRSSHDAAAVKTAIEAEGSDLDYLMIALVNKMKIRYVTGETGEDVGDTEQYDDANESIGTIDKAFESDGTWKVRKRLVQ